jgi:integrase/recombinase XerD
MTLSTGQRRHTFRNTKPRDPAITPFAFWPFPNRSFHQSFQQWLKSGGYSPSSLNAYSVAARLALGYLNKMYWAIDPNADIEIVQEYIERHYASRSTRQEYGKGLCKLAEFLRLRQDKTDAPRTVNWGYYLNGLPEWLADKVREFIAHLQKGWRPEERYRASIGMLSHLCQVLRWAAKAVPLNSIGDITPQAWFDYLDTRILRGSHPDTINGHLFRLKAFLRFLDEAGEPVCSRMLLVPPLKTGSRLPKDMPIPRLRRLLAEIEQEACATISSQQRLGVMDRAWVHLMLYSGLRTCEVRRLRVGDIDWEARRIRIEQSKGLKDRLVYFNTGTLEALQAWLVLRGEANYLSDRIFIYRHRPLSSRYCQERLETYGGRCEVKITPHQLRHSCATLLLNSGATIVTVQMLLGHEKIDTTLGYARLYDGTVAADYYRAMGQVEQVIALPENDRAVVPTLGELIALIDSLATGTLNQDQRRMLQTVRGGIIALASL